MTEQDQSYLIKETSALRKDFQSLEKRVLVERYPPIEKGLKEAQRALGDLTSKVNAMGIKGA